ncbi:hypothetical protein ANN_19293 [Periplaneta americana]|uniref:Reverse transcriptase domain-containing protein n=1 Tax=Periplaneta americana TaxID=6978 RepID=A0ABQ8SAG1_PERAM|nr:hypothetical protein ANN_19293 [Periplaneta americana]
MRWMMPSLASACWSTAVSTRPSSSANRVLFSSYIQKTNRFNKCADRALLVTDSAIYKLETKKFKAMKKGSPIHEGGSVLVHTRHGISSAMHEMTHQEIRRPNQIYRVSTAIRDQSHHNQPHDQQLDEATTSVLARGLNFIPAPKKIPVADIISNIEGAIHQLPPDSAEEIRREVARAVTKATIPKPNISREENRALQMLGKNDNLVVLPADEGNATVLLSSTQYQEKIDQLLNDPAYKILKKDPTSSVERRTNQLIKKSSLRTESKRLVSPSGSIPPRLYGLPKIHKPEVPLRPIVDAIGSPTYRLARYLTNLLQPLVGGCVHHVKNSTQSVQILDNIKVKPSDLLVSFDVVSLFTRVPLSEAMLLLSDQFPPDITELFRHTLTSTYFLQNNTYYEQIDGVAMGSPLSPAITNYYMEHLEHEILATAPLKPTHFFRYVDDMFVIWPHGQDTLPDFLRHINSQRPQIQFTMEVETNGKLPFLDILISRNNGSLGHAVYRKPTHTNLYLNANSLHHKAQQMGILNTLAHRAVSISDPEQLDTEFQHLKLTLQQNGYLAKDITASLNRARHKKQQQQPIMDSLEAEKPATACLPFTGKLSGKISRLLHKHGIKTIHKPPPKIRNKVRSVKDDLGLRVPGIYRIPCECDAAYIGQTGRTIAMRLSEHQRSIRLMQPEKSGLAEHCIEKSHRANFNNTEILVKCAGYWDRRVKEALAIAAERGNLNRDSGLQLSAAWAPAIKFLTARTMGRHQRRTCPPSPPTEAMISNVTGLSLSPGRDQLLVIHSNKGNDLVVALNTEPSHEDRVGELVGILCNRYQQVISLPVCIDQAHVGKVRKLKVNSQSSRTCLNSWDIKICAYKRSVRILGMSVRRDFTVSLFFIIAGYVMQNLSNGEQPLLESVASSAALVAVAQMEIVKLVSSRTCKEGLLLVDIMPHGTTINSDAYVATLKKLQARLSRVRRHQEKQDVLLLHNNAQP